MKKIIVFFLSFFLSFFASPLIAQTNECGFQDVPEAEYLNFLNSISPNVLIPTSGTVQQIPIHIFHVLEDDGSPFPQPYDFDAAIIAANEAFAPAMMSFYICDETYVNNTEYSNYSTGPGGDHPALYNFIHDGNALNIYHVTSITTLIGGASGLSWFPFNGNYVVIDANDWDPYLLSHELGHYFGLHHSFNQGQSGQYVNYPIVDPLINGGVPSVQTSISPPIYKACDQIGDFICDTPGDPGICVGDCSLPSNCPVLDPAGDIYNPDRNNIMSYTHDAPNCDDEHFSPDQLTRIYSTLMNSPQRSYLLNLTPTCPSSFTSVGMIERFCEPIGDHALPAQKLTISNITESETCETLTTANGEYNAAYICGLGGEIGVDIDFTVAPQLYDPTLAYHNATLGVNTYDLLLIQQHILFLANTLNTPYKLIAADVDNSGDVNTFDLIDIQQVILYFNESFNLNIPSQTEPLQATWRFFPTYYLNSNSSFNTAFFANPFTAVWQNFMGPNLNYFQYMDVLQGNLQSPYFSDNDNWSFRAIKIGDVNCSAVSPDGMLTPLVSTELLSREEGLRIDSKDINGCLKKGERGEILFKLSSAEALVAYQMGLNLDNHKLKVINLKKGNHGNFDRNNFNQDDLYLGDIKTIWWSKTGKENQFVDDKIIFSIEVEALEDICSLSDLIQPDNEILNNNFFNLEGDNVATTLSVELKSDKIIEGFGNKGLKVNVFPNPSTDKFIFELDVENSVETIITIYDRFGNSISQKIDLVKGKQNYTFDNTSKLANGLLYYSISTDKNSINGKLIKVE